MIIDRKYGSEDMGRFELIHKGIPVAVPNYVGIDLRVEGKTYRAGRNNNANAKSTQPGSAPPQTTFSKKTPDESSSSAAKNRQATQSSGNIRKSASSLDFSAEKNTTSANGTKPQENLISVDLLPVRPLSRGNRPEESPLVNEGR